MEPEFGFFNADQRWRIGVTQDRYQAQVTDAAVRQPRGRDGEIAFREEDLDRAPLDAELGRGPVQPLEHVGTAVQADERGLAVV